MTIAKVAVIGAGTMGAGVAGQTANAGLDVVLLDLKADGPDPAARARRGAARLESGAAPGLLSPERAERIQIGDTTNDLHLIADADFVLEAVVERLDVKHDLYRKLAPLMKPDAILASNTSTIPLSRLIEPLDADLRSRFCIAHFFNPVRYMRLLELVGGPETSPQTLDRVEAFCDGALGKGVVRCADSPGFLANRVGVYALQLCLCEAADRGMDIETVDALMGRPMGIPKTGIFGLYDLIGLDLMADVARSLRGLLPETDAFQPVGGENPHLNALCSEGFTGLKSGRGGFYRAAEGLVYDFRRGEWRPMRPIATEMAQADGLAALVSGDGPEAEFCRTVIARILAYAASILPEASQSPQDVDDAMKMGYNWRQGPFEMIDQLGVMRTVELMRAEGIEPPEFLTRDDGQIYQIQADALTVRRSDGARTPLRAPAGAVSLEARKPVSRVLAGNDSATLWRLGDDAALEFHTKANALDGPAMEIVAEAARAMNEGRARGVVLYNESPQFSAGVNLNVVLDYCARGDWSGLDGFLRDFQSAVMGLKYAKGPVAAAPSGLILGGGLEVALHADRLISHANIVIGLVETKVGLIPGGGGVKETYLRWFAKKGDWTEAARRTFNNIGVGATETSPELATRLTYYRDGVDAMEMNRNRLLAASLDWIAATHEVYQPPVAPDIRLAGGDAHKDNTALLEDGLLAGRLSPHDVAIRTALSRIVTGGGGAKANAPATEDDLLRGERQAFLELAQTDATRSRIRHMLTYGAPLKN